MRSFGIAAEQILERALSELRSGRGGTVLIAGDAGTGKSTLLAELTASTAAEGFKVINIRPASVQSGAPDNPWSSIVQACLDDYECRAVEADEHRSGSRYGAVGNGAEVLDQLAVNGQFEPGTARLARVSSALHKAAQLHPVLLIFDDIVRLDESSLHLIANLTQEISGEAVLIVAAYRAAAPADASRRASLDVIKRHAHNIELGALSRASTEELLKTLLGKALPPRLSDRMMQLTGGNPRLIVESEPLLFDGGELIMSASGLSTIPLGVSMAVHEHLDEVPSESLELLQCAAALGNRFDYDLLLRVVNLSREQAQSALSFLESRGIVVPELDSHYQFTQGFVREILYRELPTETRAQLHRRIAAAIEAQYPHDLEAHAEEIAHNLLMTREGRAIDEAVGYAEMAGRRFDRAGAFVKAGAMFSLALEALRWHGGEDTVRICDILTEKGLAQRNAGQLRAAEETFQSVVTYARTIGDPRRLAHLALQVPEYHWPLPGWGSPLAILLAEGALSMPAEDSALRTKLIARLAAELSYDSGQKARSQELAKSSIELAEQAGADAALKLSVRRYRDCTLRHPDRVHERLANLSQAMELARQLSDDVALHELSGSAIAAFFMLGKMSEAEALFQTFAQTAGVANRPLYSIFTLISLASRASIMGRAAEFESIFDQGRKAAENFGIPEAIERCWPALIFPMVERDRLADLLPMSAASVHAHPTSVAERALKCWLDARVGNHFEARLRLERLAADDFLEVREDDQNILVDGVALGEACIRLGSDFSHHAQRIYDLMLPFRNLQVSLGQIAAMSSVSYYLGRLAKFLERRDAAIDHLATAVNLHARLESRTLTLYATFEEAEALLGHRDSARRSQGSSLLSGVEQQMTDGEMPELAKRASRLRSDGVAVDAPGSQIDAGETVDAPNGSSNSNRASSKNGLSLNGDRRFKREADIWTLSYQGQVTRMRHLKGLALIWHLLARPNEPIHCVELDDQVDAERHLADPADRLNDGGRTKSLEEDQRALTAQWAPVNGLVGVDRLSTSAGERARLRVTFAIKSAIGRIAANHALLAHHLESSIKTGRFCVYRVDAGSPRWELI